jgi:hypothetical protein
MARPTLTGNAYDVLGLTVDADSPAIKKAYHRVAREWHPDVSKHANAKDVFAHVVRAHEILTHPQQKVVYDFLLANEIPVGSPERFQSLYGRIRHVDAVARHRHSIGWAVAATLGAVGFGLRMRWWHRQHPQASAAASAPPHATPTPPPTTTTPAPTPPTPPTTARSSAAAMGGLLGGMGCGATIVASGAAGIASARVALAASLVGALGGRLALPWVDAHAVGRRGLRTLRSRTAELLVGYSRPACELLCAAAAMLIVRRMHPAMRLADAHLRFLRAGTIGTFAGHGVARAATRNEEVEHALAAARAC